MSSSAATFPARAAGLARDSNARLARELVVGIIAFLTLVDLFATQAILPSLARHYGVSPGAMGFAVNASTFGMAVSGLAVAVLARRIDRRCGIAASLFILAIPTLLLSSAPDLATFTCLRIAQGIFMAAAFTLTLAHLGDSYATASRSMDEFIGVLGARIRSLLSLAASKEKASRKVG